MKKYILIVSLILTSGLFLQSCYYDVEEELYGAVPCDTSNVTYTASVQPILNANCTSCHGNVNPSAGIALTNHAQVSAAATSGKLSGSIEHQLGFSAMPKNGNKLNLCDRRKIQIWIDAGMPNN